MPFTEKQRALIEKHLLPDDLDGDEAKATIQVSRRDLRFLLQAIQYYHDSCCPGEEMGRECALVVWGEDVHTGAIEAACSYGCEQMIDEFLSDEVLANFPSRGARKP